MTNTDKDRILKQAIKQWGDQAQIDMMIEECAELIQALNKFRRGKENSLANVHEELADVQIMLDQMRLIFVDESIRHYEHDKLVRLANRLK